MFSLLYITNKIENKFTTKVAVWTMRNNIVAPLPKKRTVF